MMAEKWTYQHVGWYLKAMRKARAVIAEGGSVRFHWGHDALAGQAFWREVYVALDRRISAKAGEAKRGRKDCYDFDVHSFRDKVAVEDYRRFRRVLRGSGLQTAEARRRFPDVHAAMTRRWDE